MAIIFIENLQNFHYEIIESVLINYDMIIKREKSNDNIIYLRIRNEPIFISYITQKYPHIILGIPKEYDYYINCTIYDDKNVVNDGRHFYICHEVKSNLLENPHIIYLTPLLCGKSKYFNYNVLPYQDQKVKSHIPIYIIQGDLDRRCVRFINSILSREYDFDFRIKICSRKINKRLFPNKDKLIFKENLNFIDYHKEFLDCYSIIPCVCEKNNPRYYQNKLTSSINYGLVYNLKFLTDQKLVDIYELTNYEIYNSEDQITFAFEKTLKDFYKGKIAVVSARFSTDHQTDGLSSFEKVDFLDYYIFTNDKNLCPNTNYNIIEIDVTQFKNCLIATEHVKWLTHKYLPDYDYIIWLDCCFKIDNPFELIKRISEGKSIFIKTQYFMCIYDDVRWCLDNLAISSEVADNMEKYLLEHNFNIRDNSRTYWTSSMIKNNKDVNLQQMCEELFELMVNISYRDQHWLPYLFRKYNITCDFLPSDLFEQTIFANRDHHRYGELY